MVTRHKILKANQKLTASGRQRTSSLGSKEQILFALCVFYNIKKNM